MKLTIVSLAFLVSLLPQLAAGGSPISGATEGVAIQGYDAVAYYTQGKDIRGTPDHRYEWSGTVWFFSSDAHKLLFAESPEKYAPQYGGHCALSVASGGTSRGAGDAWTIRDGKLYLNGSKDVQARWLRNPAQNIYFADRQWPTLKARLESR